MHLHITLTFVIQHFGLNWKVYKIIVSHDVKVSGPWLCTWNPLLTIQFLTLLRLIDLSQSERVLVTFHILQPNPPIFLQFHRLTCGKHSQTVESVGHTDLEKRSNSGGFYSFSFCQLPYYLFSITKLSTNVGPKRKSEICSSLSECAFLRWHL